MKIKVQVVPTRTMKGAHSAKGKCMRVKRKCVWGEIVDYGGVNKRYKSEGGKPKGKREKRCRSC